MFNNNDKVFRTTGEVVFDGTMKSYTKVCDLLDLEPVSNLWRWRYRAGNCTMVVTIDDGDVQVQAGDTVKLDHGDISVIRKAAGETK